jgi:FkbM family methyltransferase
MASSYLNKLFTRVLFTRGIKTIVECGSRDCLDAVEMNTFYNPDIIYSFECNPESIPVCQETIKDINNIKLIQNAVCAVNDVVPFYATDMQKSTDKNIGASSLLLHRDNVDCFIQKKIEVQGIRLDTFMEQEKIKKIDLLCFDLQGAEYLAIEGLGDRIKDVRYIISEISFESYYHDDMIIKRFKKLLEDKGFQMMYCDAGSNLRGRTGFANGLFKNIKN